MEKEEEVKDTVISSTVSSKPLPENVTEQINLFVKNNTPKIQTFKNDVTESKPQLSKGDDTNDVVNEDLKKLIVLAEGMKSVEQGTLLKQDKSVIIKQLKYIENAINKIYSVNIGHFGLKGEIYALYDKIRASTIKYINDLSADVTSDFYETLKNNDFSELGINGFYMETFHDNTPIQKKGLFSRNKSLPDKKKQLELLIKLFEATSKDGTLIDSTIVGSHKIITGGTVASDFESILNNVIPSIVAIIFYGNTAPYKPHTLSSFTTTPKPFTPPDWFCPDKKSGKKSDEKSDEKTGKKSDEKSDEKCNKDFIDFLINKILLNDKWSTKSTKSLTITTTTPLNYNVDINDFSNIFLYNIWLLIILKFILTQNSLLLPFNTELKVDYDVINGIPANYNGHYDGLKKLIEKNLEKLKTEQDKIDKMLVKFDQIKKKPLVVTSNNSFTMLRKQSKGKKGGKKHLTKKRKLLLTLKKKYKKSRHLTKKLKKKFRK
jgi:hypothetical protein